MNRSKQKALLGLHLLLMLYSLGSIFSKAAAKAPDTAVFLVCYGCLLAVLGLYALGWQQIIKRLPLSTAYANKAATVIWGIFWGTALFGEALSPGKLLGAGLIILGICLFSREGGAAHE